MKPSDSIIKKLDDGSYLIYGLNYTPHQIIVINNNGQQTLAGDSVKYDNKFDFGPDDQKFIQENFDAWIKLGYDEIWLIPVEYSNEPFWAKNTDEKTAKAYDFSNPAKFCNTLCILFKDKIPATRGVFAADGGSLANFAFYAGGNCVHDASRFTDFQNAIHNA